MQKPKVYNITPAKGQALLNFQGRLLPSQSIEMQLFETEVIEEIKQNKEKKQNELNADFKNLLLHGDALSACAYLKSNNIKVDLVYIDPPFASGANYAKKIYLRNGSKTEFENEDNNIGEEIMYSDIWQKEDYLNWLYERLLAIREIMNEKASIYVHLDWHIGQYVKVMLDEVFGEENFINEIIWHYTSSKAPKDKYSRKHDNIYHYGKSGDYYFSPILKKSGEFSKTKYNLEDEKGKYKLVRGYKKYWKEEIPIDDVWGIPLENVQSKENTKYNTQKPVELLKRVINTASTENMVIADFFSGSGTTAKVAYDLDRKFIACDIGLNAVETTRDRLVKAGAEFDILKIKDGVRLFRNPAQTTQKIFSLIDGFQSRTELELGEFWDGGIVSNKGSFEPVKFIGIDKNLTKELLDVVLEEIYSLEETENGTSKVNIIYTYKNLEIDQAYINKEIKNSGKTTIEVKLISLDDLLAEKRDMLFASDSAVIEVSKKDNRTIVEIKQYFSPYIKTKIDEYNAKKVKMGTLEVDETKAVTISERGLELIEAVQFDTELKKSGVWTSNLEIEDKAGIKDKIKGIYELPVDKFKIKIRNISGDEIILDYII